MSLRVLTLNVWGLPWPVGEDVPERVAAIGDALPAIAPDLAAFQEAWTEDTRTALAEAGRRAGLAHAFPDPEGPLRGGLLVLSRAPLRNARFVPFALNGFPERVDHADYWGGKGFVACEVEFSSGALALAATHLHARYAERASDPYVGHRTAQVVQLATALRATRLPLVALGDFNFEEGFEEHAVLVGTTGLEDAARSLDRREDTVRWPGSGRLLPGTRARRIDYVFFRSGRGASVAPVGIERVLDAPVQLGGRETTYSDHAGLLAELALAPGGAAPPPVAPEALALARELLLDGRDDAAKRRRAQRWSGAGALAAAGLAAAPALRARLSRRQLLGGGVAALAGLAGGGCLFLSEEVRPAELDAFDATLAQLDELAR